METKTCTNCGSKYRLTYTRTPMRDNDYIICEVCSKKLHSWNEAKIWEATLVERHEDHMKS